MICTSYYNTYHHFQTKLPAKAGSSGLHLLSLKCCGHLPAPCSDERWHDNPRAVRADEIRPEVEWTRPEVEASQVCGDEVEQASVELAQANGELEDVGVGLAGCNCIAASRKLVVRIRSRLILSSVLILSSRERNSFQRAHSFLSRKKGADGRRRRRRRLRPLFPRLRPRCRW